PSTATFSSLTLTYQKNTTAHQGAGVFALVQLHIYNHELVRRQRLLEYRFQFFSLSHGETFGAVEFGEFRQVRDKKLGADDSAAVGFDLVALHAAVGVVAQDQHEDRNLVVGRGGELLLLHHERAVAGDADHARVGTAELDAHRGCERGADGEERAGVDDRIDRVDAAQRIAGHARGREDLIAGEQLVQRLHHRLVSQYLVRGFLFDVVSPGVLGLLDRFRARGVRRLGLSLFDFVDDRAQGNLGIGRDRQGAAILPAEFVRIGVDLHD